MNNCVVIVPANGRIEPACESSLRELERRGYTVRRAPGYSAIDQARNQLATDALVEGCSATMWIDADVGFSPEDVERLRGHDLPMCCGIYPKKSERSLSCHVLPGTDKLVFGQQGGIHEIRYAATGFLYVKAEVYKRIKVQLKLPVCNRQFGRPLVPYFQPLVVRDGDEHWYLAEDYAFSERARQCGFKIYADTTIRLFHYGSYGYSWEDAGADVQRFGTYYYNLV